MRRGPPGAAGPEPQPTSSARQHHANPAAPGPKTASQSAVCARTTAAVETAALRRELQEKGPAPSPEPSPRPGTRAKPGRNPRPAPQPPGPEGQAPYDDPRPGVHAPPGHPPAIHLPTGRAGCGASSTQNTPIDPDILDLQTKPLAEDGRPGSTPATPGAQQIPARHLHPGPAHGNLHNQRNPGRRADQQNESRQRHWASTPTRAAPATAKFPDLEQPIKFRERTEYPERRKPRPTADPIQEGAGP